MAENKNKNFEDRAELHAVNQQLKADHQQQRALNQQLKATEQQLRAANQQLKADHQQLQEDQQQQRALNQQLKATEQQLRAANQQLKEDHQQLQADQQQLQEDQQQLRALNQQLKATEQQLRAANQQLTASEQQLKAINQQLKAEVTLRNKTEEDAIKAKVQIENYLNIAGVMLTATDDKENITIMNKKGYEILGYKEGELVGKNWFNTLVPERIRAEIRGVYNQLMSGDVKPVEYCENPLLTKDGEEKIMAFHNTIIRNQDNKMTGVLFSAEDITDRKKMEKELQRLAGFWESIVENANVYMDVLDENGNVIIWNKAAEKISGYTRDEVIGHSKIWQWQYPDPEYRKKMTDIASQVIEGGELKEYESEILTKSGEKRVISWYSRNLTDQNGKTIGAVATGVDVTKRKRAEEEILNKQKQLRALTTKLSSIEQSERRCIAESIHDSIIQPLVFLDIKVDSLGKTTRDAELINSFYQMRTILAELIEKARSFTFDLSYPILYELGLEPAIEEWLRTEIEEKHKIAVEFKRCGLSKNLDHSLTAFLFKSVKELLVNVVKHADANKVKVSAAKERNNIVICVEDDGYGFDINSAKKKQGELSGFGLFNIREQLVYLGGELKIKSKLDVGSKIILTVPLEVKD